MPSKSKFTVQGVGNLLVQIARCCQPLPGEPISGYMTRGRGISVHRADCIALLRLAAANPQRVLPVEWGVAGGGYEAVSYTHLDVYKRQVAACYAALGVVHAPVSYTHLDVYKRQWSTCCPAKGARKTAFPSISRWAMRACRCTCLLYTSRCV